MFQAWKEQVREVAAMPWARVSGLAFGSLAGLMGLIALLQATSREGWVPLLDGVNLVFHEAGHPLFSPFGETLHLLGGTLMQLLVPLAVAGSGWWKRQVGLTAFGGFWAAQNLHNIARYLGDARALELPLVGGGEHDWNLLLGGWGLLHRDTAVAQALHGFGWIGMIAAAAWLAWRWWQGRGLEGVVAGEG